MLGSQWAECTVRNQDLRAELTHQLSGPAASSLLYRKSELASCNKLRFLNVKTVKKFSYHFNENITCEN